MKKFREYISEEVVPTALVKDGSIDLDKEEVRASINMALAKVTSDSSITPYIALNRISKALSYFHIIIPKRVYLEGAKGVEVHELRQFGDRMGMNDQGEFIRDVQGKYYLFIQYGMNTPMNHGGQIAVPTMGGTFRVIAKVVDQTELDRLVSMAELSLAEECDAEMQQLKAKMTALKEPMHDVTSDKKKVGNKKAVAQMDEEELDEADAANDNDHDKPQPIQNIMSKEYQDTHPSPFSSKSSTDGNTKDWASRHLNVVKEAKKIKVKLNPEKEVGHTVHDVGPGGKKTLVKSGKMKVKDINEEGFLDKVRSMNPFNQLADKLSVPGASAAPKNDGKIYGNPDFNKKPNTTAPVKEENLDEGAHKALKAAGFTAGRKGSDTGFGRSYSHPKHGSAYVDADGFAHFGSGKKTTVTHGAKDTAAHLGKLKEGVGEPITGSRRHPGSADRKRKAVQMALGRKHKGEEGWNDRMNLQAASLRMGRSLQKKGVVREEEQIDEVSLKTKISAYKARASMNRHSGASFDDDDAAAAHSQKMQDKTMAHIKKRHGEKGAEAAEKSGSHKKKYNKVGAVADPVAYAPAWKLKIMKRGERKGKLDPKDQESVKKVHQTKLDKIRSATKPNLKEETINEISQKLALKAMKASEKRSDDEWEADAAYDRLSDWKTHDARAHRLRGHMKRKFGKKKIKTDGEDHLKDYDGYSGRQGVHTVNTHGKRAGLPPKEQVNRLKSNIKYSLGKHHKPNLPEETQIDERERSNAYVTTVKHGDSGDDKKLAAIKNAVKGYNKAKGTKIKVDRAGRLGKDNPHAKDYNTKSGGRTYQKIRQGEASKSDVYLRGKPEYTGAGNYKERQEHIRKIKHGIENKFKKQMEEETISEKAPPGAKYERMVKHIKAGYAKDGLTKKEKGIAYATAWKAKNRQDEELKFDPSTEIPKNS